MAIRAILWDVDGTLLDFLASEKAAVQRLFGEFGLGPCTDGMVARYSAINDAYWKRLERSEITKAEVLVGRYRDFFSELGIDPACEDSFLDISSAIRNRLTLARMTRLIVK